MVCFAKNTFNLKKIRLAGLVQPSDQAAAASTRELIHMCLHSK